MKNRVPGPLLLPSLLLGFLLLSLFSSGAPQTAGAGQSAESAEPQPTPQVGQLLAEAKSHLDARRPAEPLPLVGWMHTGAVPPAQPRQADPRLEEVQRLLRVGRYADAEGKARAALAEIEVAQGGESLAVAQILDALAEALRQQAKLQDGEARMLAERAVALKEKALGHEQPEVARSLHNLGVLLSDLGDHKQAKAAFERALSIRERAFGPSHPETATTMRELGWLVRRMNEPQRSRQLIERALAIHEEMLGPNHPEVASDLRAIGVFLTNSGDAQGGVRAVKRALEIREQAFGPSHPEVGMILITYNYVLSKAGDISGARDAIERCYETLKNSVGPDHPNTGHAMNNLGALAYETGDYTGARMWWERTLALWEKRLGPEHPDVARALTNVGMIYMAVGEFTSARSVLVRALAIDEKRLGPEAYPLSFAYHNLGIVHQATGNYEESLRHLERALQIKEKSEGPDHFYNINTLWELSDTHALMGNYAKAEALLERALAIAQKREGPPTGDVGITLARLAELRMRTSDYAAARSLLERSLATLEANEPLDHPVLLHALTPLGELQLTLGNYAAARPLLERVRSIIVKAAGPEDARMAEVLGKLAELAALTGEPEKALETALEAERLSREHVRLTAGMLSEREALMYSSARVSGLHIALGVAADHPFQPWASAKTIWDALIRSRALVLDEMAARHHAARGAEDPRVRRLNYELRIARERLARLAVREVGKDPEEYRRIVEDARRQREAAERALAEVSHVFREDVARARAGLEEVARSLPERSALVAYARYGQFSLVKPGEKRSEPVPRYLAFVLSAGDQRVTLVPLGAAQEIEANVRNLRQQIAEQAEEPTRASKRSEGSYRTAGRALRRRVWDPVAPHVGKAQRVFIVPDGVLHLVNLAALPIGGSGYLIQTGPRIHYLSAERDLVPLPEQEKAGEGILTVGAPAFDEKGLFAQLAPQPTAPGGSAAVRPTAGATFRGSRSACGNFQTMRFEPLPASARETLEIAALWQRPAGTLRGEAVRAVQLTGVEASEAAFKQQAPGKRVLHLATHGFFLGGKCESALDPSEKNRGDAPVVKGENPLVLSGLALAGANHRQAAGPEEEDGILTAEEIASLDLSGVEWAVLSACDTGVGEVKAGEGVLGLRRAFQVAGARTLIMSLWPVEDTAARAWMSELYRARLTQGQTTIDAVHQASLKTLRARRAKGQSTHPFYWAGFVAAGDWR